MITNKRLQRKQLHHKKYLQITQMSNDVKTTIGRQFEIIQISEQYYININQIIKEIMLVDSIKELSRYMNKKNRNW